MFSCVIHMVLSCLYLLEFGCSLTSWGISQNRYCILKELTFYVGYTKTNIKLHI